MKIKKFTPVTISGADWYRPKAHKARLNAASLVAAFASQNQQHEIMPSTALADAIAQLRSLDADCALAVSYAERLPCLTDWLADNFAEVMARRELKSEGRAAIDASLWQKKLVGLLLPSLVILRFKYHLVPDFSPAQIKIDAESGGKINQLLLGENYYFDTDEQKLDEQFQQALLAFAEPLLTIFDAYQLNKKRFWGNISNALAQGFTSLSYHGDPQALALLTEQMNLWLERVLPPNYNLAQLHLIGDGNQGRWFVRRHTCCLKYKLSGAKKCNTCNLIAETAQRQFYYQQYFEGKKS